MELLEHKNFGRQHNFLHHTCRVPFGIVSGGSSSAVGASLKAPASTCPGIRWANSTLISKLSAVTALSFSFAHRSSALLVRRCYSRASQLQKRCIAKRTSGSFTMRLLCRKVRLSRSPISFSTLLMANIVSAPSAMKAKVKLSLVRAVTTRRREQRSFKNVLSAQSPAD